MSLFHKDVTKKIYRSAFSIPVIRHYRKTHSKVPSIKRTITLRKLIYEEILKNLAKINLRFFLNFSIKIYDKEN